MNDTFRNTLDAYIEQLVARGIRSSQYHLYIGAFIDEWNESAPAQGFPAITATQREAILRQCVPVTADAV